MPPLTGVKVSIGPSLALNLIGSLLSVERGKRDRQARDLFSEISCLARDIVRINSPSYNNEAALPGNDLGVAFRIPRTLRGNVIDQVSLRQV